MKERKEGEEKKTMNKGHTVSGNAVLSGDVARRRLKAEGKDLQLKFGV